MPFDAHVNFAYSTVATAPVPATSGLSLIVQTGDGALFPSASFNASIFPAGTNPTPSNAEIVRVTVVSTDTFTIARAQEGTTARTVIVGDQILCGPTASVLTTIENAAKVRTTSLDFTDGSLVKRFTISDASVASTSLIVCAAQKNQTENDVGFVYMANIASVGTGTFDVVVWALSGEDGTGTPVYPLPSETITLSYQVF